MDPSCSPPEAGGASHPNREPEKPRLTKNDHTFLEQQFQLHHKPSALNKNDFANQLGVPLSKINVSDDPSLLPHA
jgi:hypothetical protein